MVTGRHGPYSETVHVEIGPVPSASAQAYLRFCREMLASLQADPGPVASTLSPEVCASFDAYLTEWEAVAARGPLFTWESDEDVEHVEHVFVAFFRCVAEVLRRTEANPPPPEDVELRRPFRIALTNAVLNALAAEGHSSSLLAEQLRSNWPEDDLD